MGWGGDEILVASTGAVLEDRLEALLGRAASCMVASGGATPTHSSGSGAAGLGGPGARSVS